MAYCSIMTLLLAFFIVLQAFASVQSDGLFYAGQGSFVRALETFGLGGLWEPPTGHIVHGGKGARYRTDEGQDETPLERRIDPEMEEAQLALASLQDQFQTEKPASGAGWRVVLSTPVAYGPDKDELAPEEERFCRELSRRLAPLLVARGFVIRIGSDLECPPEDEAAQTRFALDAAAQVRGEIIQSMAPVARPAAASRIYSFCRRRTDQEEASELPAGRLRVDILLTKPYYPEAATEGKQDSENAQTQ